LARLGMDIDLVWRGKGLAHCARRFVLPQRKYGANRGQLRPLSRRWIPPRSNRFSLLQLDVSFSRRHPI